MEFAKFFEGKDLLVVKQEVGMISIDTMDRQWDFVKDLGDNRLVLIFGEDKHMALIGHLAKRDDGKDCFVIELKAQIENGELCGMEQWHIMPRDYMLRFGELTDALRAGGHLG